MASTPAKVSAIKELDDSERIKTSSRQLLAFSFGSLYVGCVASLIFGVLGAFAIGILFDRHLLFDYEWTCGRQSLPSISRVINLPAERVVWHMAGLVHIPLRLLIVALNSKFVVANFRRRAKNGALHLTSGVLVAGAATVEIASFVALTVVGEREDGNFHVAFFISFVAAAGVHFSLFTAFSRQIVKDTNRNKYCNVNYSKRNLVPQHFSTGSDDRTITEVTVATTVTVEEIKKCEESFEKKNFVEQQYYEYDHKKQHDKQQKTADSKIFVLPQQEQQVNDNKMVEQQSIQNNDATVTAADCRVSDLMALYDTLSHQKPKMCQTIKICRAPILRRQNFPPVGYCTKTQWRLRLGILIAAFMAATVVFTSFNLNLFYCTLYAYTVFTLSEYFTVITIVAFNATVIFELRHFEFAIFVSRENLAASRAQNSFTAAPAA